jgi:hypothetical protein
MVSLCPAAASAAAAAAPAMLLLHFLSNVSCLLTVACAAAFAAAAAADWVFLGSALAAVAPEACAVALLRWWWLHCKPRSVKCKVCTACGAHGASSVDNTSMLLMHAPAADACRHCCTWSAHIPASKASRLFTCRLLLSQLSIIRHVLLHCSSSHCKHCCPCMPLEHQSALAAILASRCVVNASARTSLPVMCCTSLTLLLSTFLNPEPVPLLLLLLLSSLRGPLTGNEALLQLAVAGKAR